MEDEEIGHSALKKPRKKKFVKLKIVFCHFNLGVSKWREQTESAVRMLLGKIIIKFGKNLGLKNEEKGSSITFLFSPFRCITNSL